MTERKTVTIAELTGLVSNGTLNLAGRSLTELPELTEFLNLKKIDLSNNALDSVSGVKHNIQVTWFSVKSNKLTKLNAISRMKNLVVLNAALNELKDFDPSPHPKLSALILNNNQLTKIPNLENNPELNTLVLSHNKIEEMTAVLSKLGKMKKLALSHNQIREISFISDQFYLHELKLNDNKIRTLPESMSKNVKLEILDLGNNQIKDFDDIKVLSTLRGLKILNLKGNPITQKASYPEQLFALCPFIRNLDGKKREFKSKNFVTSNVKGSVPEKPASDAVSNRDSHKRKRDDTDANEEPALKRRKTEQEDQADGGSEDEPEMEIERENNRKDKQDNQKRNQIQAPARQHDSKPFQHRNDQSRGPKPNNATPVTQRPAPHARNENNSRPQMNKPANQNSSQPPRNKNGPRQQPSKKGNPEPEQSVKVDHDEKPKQAKKAKNSDDLEELRMRGATTGVKEVHIKVTDERQSALVEEPRPDHVTGPSSGIVNIKLAPQKKQFSVKDLLSTSDQQIAGW